MYLYSMTYHLGYQIKQYEMHETSGMHGREEFLWGNPKEQDHLDNMGVKARILLKKFLNKEDGIAWTRVIWLRTGTQDKSNKHSASIK